MSEKLIKLIKMNQASAEPKVKREAAVSWLNILDELANKPIEEEVLEQKEEAPESPDPRMNHRSKLVRGLSKDLSAQDLELERKRLREAYMGLRAESVLHEKKFGREPKKINYNEFC